MNIIKEIQPTDFCVKEDEDDEPISCGDETLAGCYADNERVSQILFLKIVDH